MALLSRSTVVGQFEWHALSLRRAWNQAPLNVTPSQTQGVPHLVLRQTDPLPAAPIRRTPAQDAYPLGGMFLAILMPSNLGSATPLESTSHHSESHAIPSPRHDEVEQTAAYSDVGPTVSPVERRVGGEVQ